MDNKYFKSISKSGFIISLFNKSKPIYLSYIKSKSKGKENQWTQSAPKSSIILKNMLELSFKLSVVFEDIEKTMKFIEVEDKGKIKELFPWLSEQKDYFKYHHENLSIRLISIQDLVGKILNELFQTKIKDYRCNLKTFRDKIEHSNPSLFSKCENLLNFMEDNKDERNKKIHEGDVELKSLDELLIFEDLNQVMGWETSESEQIITEKMFQDIFNKAEKYINDIIELILQIFTEIEPELEALQTSE